jgi:hypothetical protein
MKEIKAVSYVEATKAGDANDEEVTKASNKFDAGRYEELLKTYIHI